MGKTLLAQVDDRAKSLGLSRSQYLAQLARRDIAEKGAMILADASAPKAAGTDAQSNAGVREISSYGPLLKSPRRGKTGA